MSKVTFTESVIDTGVFAGMDSFEKKKIDLDNGLKYGIVSFGEGMLMRDTIRNRIDGIQTEPIVKNIAASAISKSLGLGIYEYFSGGSIGMEIVKKCVTAAIGTGIVKYYFNV